MVKTIYLGFCIACNLVTFIYVQSNLLSENQIIPMLLDIVHFTVLLCLLVLISYSEFHH